MEMWPSHRVLHFNLKKKKGEKSPDCKTLKSIWPDCSSLLTVFSALNIYAESPQSDVVAREFVSQPLTVDVLSIYRPVDTIDVPHAVAVER